VDNILICYYFCVVVTQNLPSLEKLTSKKKSIKLYFTVDAQRRGHPKWITPLLYRLGNLTAFVLTTVFSMWSEHADL